MSAEQPSEKLYCHADCILRKPFDELGVEPRLNEFCEEAGRYLASLGVQTYIENCPLLERGRRADSA